MGGRAAAAQKYPYELCEAICRGVAARKKADTSRIFSALPMCERDVSSLSSLCQEATFDMSGQKSCWLGLADKCIGDDPQCCSDGIHELDGHALVSTLVSRGNEALYIMKRMR